jgi:hypothetical protein
MADADGRVPVVVDDESVNVLDPETLRVDWSGVRHLCDLMRSIRSMSPGVRLGLYRMVPPSAGAWYPITRRDDLPGKYGQWLQSARRIMGALSPHVDILYPSLYCQQTVMDGNEVDERRTWASWDLYMREILRMASEPGRAVIPFVSPEYHPSSRAGAVYVGDGMMAKCMDTILWAENAGLIEGCVVYASPEADLSGFTDYGS